MKIYKKQKISNEMKTFCTNRKDLVYIEFYDDVYMQIFARNVKYSVAPLQRWFRGKK